MLKKSEFFVSGANDPTPLKPIESDACRRSGILAGDSSKHLGNSAVAARTIKSKRLLQSCSRTLQQDLSRMRELGF